MAARSKIFTRSLVAFLALQPAVLTTAADAFPLEVPGYAAAAVAVLAAPALSDPNLAPVPVLTIAAPEPALAVAAPAVATRG
ncbi:MAG: hypothetical protein GC186_15665 [Rhodobacteraceae bacterium]|nr:hypothetical protein [Paracoccaceae bacterium]